MSKGEVMPSLVTEQDAILFPLQLLEFCVSCQTEASSGTETKRPSRRVEQSRKRLGSPALKPVVPFLQFTKCENWSKSLTPLRLRVLTSEMGFLSPGCLRRGEVVTHINTWWRVLTLNGSH